MCQTLHELLVRASAENPDGTALVGTDSTMSYAELYRAANGLAGSLIAAGIVPGDRVGLCLPKTSDAIVSVYGILLTGASYVPIDPAAPAERAVQIALNVETRALVTTPDRAQSIGPVIAEKLGHLDVFIKESTESLDLPHCSIHRWASSDGSIVQMPAVGENELAYILHTSGSTGRPKGVAISHKSALTFVNMAADFFSIRKDDRLCSQAPLHFDLSVFDLYVACRQQAAVVLIPDYYSAFPKKFVSAIFDHGITVWNSVSSALTLMMEKGQPDPDALKTIRVVLFSGEAMPTKYLRMLQDNFANAGLYHGYGQTEANTSMYYPVKLIPNADWRVPIGKAFPEYEVFALDQNGVEIDKPDSEGELFVCSDAVADGYWGNRELTKTKFQFNTEGERLSSRVFRTGDRVRLNIDGDFEFVGRADDMIKSRGYRIELGEIEHTILSCRGVATAACVALPDETVGNRLFGFASCTDGTDLSESEVTTHIRRLLPAYMIPEKLFLRKELPHTSTGKIDRNTLRNEAKATLDPVGKIE